MLETFRNEEFGEIRTKEENGEIWFVASDICKSLDIKNTTQAINRLDEDEKSMLNIGLPGGSTNLVNEYGLYSLVLESRKKKAKEFKRWITHDVIPAIRKHGAYLTDTKIEEILNNPDTIIKLATDLKTEKEEKRKLELENMQKQQIIGELQPKADYTDRILQNKGLVTITAIAKDYGMSAQEMNDKLHELNVQYKQSDQWFLYAKYQDKGYTHSETIDLKHKNGNPFVKMNTKWTQKGRLFIYDLLKENGLVPVIEKEA